MGKPTFTEMVESLKLTEASKKDLKTFYETMWEEADRRGGAEADGMRSVLHSFRVVFLK
jgi:hypothetical protein